MSYSGDMYKRFVERPRISLLEGKYSNVRGFSLFYRVSTQPLPEDAPALIMLHGMVVSGRYYSRLAHRLAHRYRIYIPDLVGFGKSTKGPRALTIEQSVEIVREWMQVLGLQQSILLGQSYGCQVVTALAVTYPELVQQLILLDPTLEPRARRFPYLLWNWFINMLREPPTLYPILVQDLYDAGIFRSLNILNYMLHDRIEERLPLIQQPVLVMRGSRDTIAPQTWCEQVTQLLPQGQLVVINHKAHDAHFSNPGQAALRIQQFLSNTLPPSTPNSTSAAPGAFSCQ